MTQEDSSEQLQAEVAGQTYDHIYIESWEATISECEKRLEPVDYARALEVKNADDFRAELDKIKHQYSDAAPMHVIMLLYPTLNHYEQFAQSFVKMMADKVEVSMLWGLLFLVIKLSLESQFTIEKVTEMLEKIGHELRKLHGYAQAMPTGYSTIMGDAAEIHREIIILWLNIIGMYRKQHYETTKKITIENLTSLCEKAMRNIGDAVVRVEKLAALAERQTRLIDLERFQKLLARDDDRNKDASPLPCFVLPVAENKRFFGRKDTLRQIDDLLQPESDMSGIRSAALWGLGGVGKTQTAIAYAYSKRETLGKPEGIDAVFWFPAETQLSLLQAFSKIAVNHLKLPTASHGADQENMILVQTWLNQTKSKWLLIFDNVEDHQVLSDVWPVAVRGSILITTRNPTIATQPVDVGIELKEFSISQGADLLHHLLTSRKRSEVEDTAATKVSELLNGYPLAINQMAAYINSRGMKIETFLGMYEKYPRKLHREKKPGWKYVGYNHALDTVWDLSFKSLDKNASKMLSVLSFLSPDSIPLELFQAPDLPQAANREAFYEDDVTLWDAIEQLTNTALVRNDVNSECLGLHRLVQAESRFRISENERQEAFDAAVRLVLSKFPERGLGAPRVDLWEKGLKYLEHILSIANDWHDSQQRIEPLGATRDLCNLMANTAFFIEDNDPVGMLSITVNVASEAYRRLPESMKDRNLWADIRQETAFRDLKEGAFDSCEQLGLEIYKIREELGQTSDVLISNTYNLIGLACDSAGRHEDAQGWLLKAIDAGKGEGEEIRRLAARNHLNMARNRYSVGDFEEAEKQCRLSAAASEKFEWTWNVWAFIYETQASLYRRSGNLEQAKRFVDMAQGALERGGSVATTSWTAGICAYRAAEVAILQGQVQDAIDQAQRSTTLNRLYKAPIGTLARSTHLLHRALSLDPARDDEARRAKHDAQKLRELLPAGRTDLSDESDEAYEKLVDIIQR